MLHQRLYERSSKKKRWFFFNFLWIVIIHNTTKLLFEKTTPFLPVPYPIHPLALKLFSCPKVTSFAITKVVKVFLNRPAAVSWELQSIYDKRC